uniref:IS5 family transposase n=1 Tax=Roseihalotalea indica TaxID=2867963 RepID=A0AA49JID5_9BACT|nr:IS5 family transposase [Tunicatimonas sp. TK19036]
MRRYELSDEHWDKIADLFPSNEGKRGAPWQNHRQILNGMLWVLCSGAPWRDLPERYGSWKTVYDRFRRYRKEGMFDRILACLQLQLNEEGLIDYHLWEVDSTTVRAHKSTAGAGRKRGIKPKKMNPRIMP